MEGKHSLAVVGSGIKFMSHLTIEAKAHIQQSDKVLYLLNEPAMKEWVQTNNANTESLEDLYYKFPIRLDCYAAITQHILDTLQKTPRLCVVIYGHPAVFSKPALDAAIQAKKMGFVARLLPGISAEDCLFADLMIDPGCYGCQSIEATELLLYRKKIDNSMHLLLWQVGMIGLLGRDPDFDSRASTKILSEYLYQFYSPTHQVILYEAALYPHEAPHILELALQELSELRLSRITTLYIPPSRQASMDENMLSVLGIDKNELMRK